MCNQGLGSENGGRTVVKETKDIWDKDFGDIIVDREKTKRFSYRYRGSMRMSMGLFFSNNEYDCWRNAVLSKKLP